MSSLAFNSDLTASLNELHNLPLPIFKLVCTQVFQSLSEKSALNLSQLRQILHNERVMGCDLGKGINALQYVVKQPSPYSRYSVKKQLSFKAAITFLKDNTLLCEEFLEHFYQESENMRTNSRSPSQATLLASNWAVCNLRQTKKGDIINQMYVKTQLKTLEDGCENIQVFTTQLPEHKLLLNEINQISSRIK